MIYCAGLQNGNNGKIRIELTDRLFQTTTNLDRDNMHAYIFRGSFCSNELPKAVMEQSTSYLTTILNVKWHTLSWNQKVTRCSFEFQLKLRTFITRSGRCCAFEGHAKPLVIDHLLVFFTLLFLKKFSLLLMKPVAGCDWSAANDLMVSSSLDGTICLWHVGTRTCLRSVRDQVGAEILACLFQPSNNNMVIVSFSNQLLTQIIIILLT